MPGLIFMKEILEKKNEYKLTFSSFRNVVYKNYKSSDGSAFRAYIKEKKLKIFIAH